MEHASIRARKSFWPRLLAALALLAMLIVGRYTYRDYGITVDETVERDSTLINYQYAFQTLFGRDLSLSDQPLETYKDRHYGVTLQMPTVMVEHLTGFTMPSRDIYMLRHLWTFLLCLSGLACFYLFLERVLSNRWYALLGLLMLALYPRFWGEQFTNIKDMVFMAACCWALLATALSLRHEGKWRWEILSALLFALCANTRVIGFLFPSLLFGYRVLRDGRADARVEERRRPAVLCSAGKTRSGAPVDAGVLCAGHARCMGFSAYFPHRNIPRVLELQHLERDGLFPGRLVFRQRASLVLPSRMAVPFHPAVVSGLHACRGRWGGSVCPAQPSPVGDCVAPACCLDRAAGSCCA